MVTFIEILYMYTSQCYSHSILFCLEFPEVEVTGNTSVTAGEGNSTSFTCTVSGHPKPVVSWIFSGGSLSFGDRIVKNEGHYSIIS